MENIINGHSIGQSIKAEGEPPNTSCLVHNPLQFYDDVVPILKLVPDNFRNVELPFIQLIFVSSTWTVNWLGPAEIYSQ